jgi:hypothetical protein
MSGMWPSCHRSRSDVRERTEFRERGQTGRLKMAKCEVLVTHSATGEWVRFAVETRSAPALNVVYESVPGIALLASTVNGGSFLAVSSFTSMSTPKLQSRRDRRENARLHRWAPALGGSLGKSRGALTTRRIPSWTRRADPANGPLRATWRALSLPSNNQEIDGCGSAQPSP